MNKRGQVYLMTSDAGYQKIGLTLKSPSARMASINQVVPFDLKIAACSEPFEISKKTDIAAVEKWFFAMYQDCRIKGEWFRLNDSQIETIKRDIRNTTLLGNILEMAREARILARTKRMARVAKLRAARAEAKARRDAIAAQWVDVAFEP